MPDDYSSGAVFAGSHPPAQISGVFVGGKLGPAVMAVSFAPELISCTCWPAPVQGEALHTATVHAGNAGRDPAAGNCA